MKVHPTSHVPLLKPFKEGTLWPDHKEVMRPPPNLIGNYSAYEVEGNFKCRSSKQKQKEYLVKWLGYLLEATRVATKNMVNAKVLVEHFEIKIKAKWSNK